MKFSSGFISFILLLEHHVTIVNGAGRFRSFLQGLRGNQQGSSSGTPTGPPGSGNGNVPSGGDGPDGRGPPMFPPFINFVNNTCPVNTDASTPCMVGPPNNQTAGAWVCRTLYNIVTGDSDTFSACVDTNHFLDTDSCGCCGGSCPSTDPCTCTCDLPSKPDHGDRLLQGGNFGPPPGNFNGTFGPPPGNFNGTFGPPPGNFNDTLVNVTGVLVQVVGDDKTMCIPTNMSSKMINGPGFFGRFECVTTCT